ncbi:MAG: ABC transporter ATP-binding protein [Acidimicrobiales bacterium]
MNRIVRDQLVDTIRPYRGRIALATALSIVQALALLPIPLLLGYAFDTALPDERKGLVLGLAAGVSAAVLVSGAASVVSMYFQIGTATRIGQDLRGALIRRLFDAPRTMFDRSLVGDIHDRVVTDSLRAVEMFGAALNKLVPDIVITVGVAIILAILDVQLALVTLGFLPLVLLVSRFMIARQTPATRHYHQVFREFSTRVMRITRSQDLIRVTGSEGRELTAGDQELAMLTGAHSRFEFIAAAHRAAQQSIIGLAGAALLVAGGAAVIDTSMTLGELLAFYAAFAMLRGPAGRSAGAYSELISGWHAYQRVIDFLHDPSSRPYHGTRAADAGDEFSFHDVSFGYTDDTQVVDRLSFTMTPGSVTALIGPNGSGKSTVVSLLLGFYRPDGGAIRIGDLGYDEVDLHDLRRQFGVVPQEPFLLPGSIHENITYGADPTDAELEQALAVSGADAVVDGLPKGIDTVVGEDGQLLSGGQRQRISIARALLGEPKVLVLDEPTNHLDEAAIGDFLRRLNDLRSTMTVLLISHHRAVTALADHTVELREQAG